jgi:hypothetical protein
MSVYLVAPVVVSSVPPAGSRMLFAYPFPIVNGILCEGRGRRMVACAMVPQGGDATARWSPPCRNGQPGPITTWSQAWNTGWGRPGKNCMVTIAEFLPDDQRKLDAMLEIASRRAGCLITLEALVERWQAFVGELERGHRSSSCELEDELMVRALLEELCECLSEHGRQRVLAGVLDSDRRFLALTVPVNAKAGRQWWDRIPQDMAPA